MPKRAERNEHTEADRRLQIGGESNRAASVKGQVHLVAGDDVSHSNTTRIALPSTTPRVRRRELQDSDEEDSAWLCSQVASKSTPF